MYTSATCTRSGNLMYVVNVLRNSARGGTFANISTWCIGISNHINVHNAKERLDIKVICVNMSWNFTYKMDDHFNALYLVAELSLLD